MKRKNISWFYTYAWDRQWSFPFIILHILQIQPKPFHDIDYYTETEIESLIAAVLNAYISWNSSIKTFMSHNQSYNIFLNPTS